VDFKKLGNILTAAGAVALIGAGFWWFAFYTSVVRDLGRLTGGGADASLSDALTCLYSSGGMCLEPHRQDPLRAHTVLVRLGRPHPGPPHSLGGQAVGNDLSMRVLTQDWKKRQCPSS